MKRWLAIFLATVFLAAAFFTKSHWDGDVTEAAAGSLAVQQGRAETQVLPWRLEGDLLLFVFLTGGLVAGFAAGYYWRGLFGARGNELHDKSDEKLK